MDQTSSGGKTLMPHNLEHMDQRSQCECDPGTPVLLFSVYLRKVDPGVCHLSFEITFSFSILTETALLINKEIISNLV